MGDALDKHCDGCKVLHVEEEPGFDVVDMSYPGSIELARSLARRLGYANANLMEARPGPEQEELGGEQGEIQDGQDAEGN